MPFYIYSPTVTPVVRQLQAELGAKRLIRHDGMRFLNKGMPVEFTPQDAIICWGAHVPAVPGVPCLNASLHYTTLLSVNQKATKKLRDLGISAFSPSTLPLDAWHNMLRETGDNWWPPVTRKWKYRTVAIPELEGYATPFYRFSDVAKIVFFQGAALTGDMPEPLQRAVAQMSLDFGEIWYGNSVDAPYYVLKITTAPSLNQQELKLFADRVVDWRKLQPEGNAWSLE